MGRLSARVQAAERFGQVFLAGVDRAVANRWDHAVWAAAATRGSKRQRIRQLERRFGRELAAVGAATGAVAALPVAGTGTTITAGVAEMGVFTMRAADLILAVAAVHGHTQSSVEQRRSWVLSVLVLGDGAAEGFTRLAAELGKGLASTTTRRVPIELLRSVNSSLAASIVTKYGKKRGVIAVGTALPMGIGAAVGGSANYAMVHTIARQADKFFGQLPPVLDGSIIDTRLV